MKIALLYAQNFDGLILSFPQNPNLAGRGIANEGSTSTRLGIKGIPGLAEEIQVARDLFILEYTDNVIDVKVKCLRVPAGRSNGPTQTQINGARVDKSTRLPEGIQPPGPSFVDHVQSRLASLVSG